MREKRDLGMLSKFRVGEGALGERCRVGERPSSRPVTGSEFDDFERWGLGEGGALTSRVGSASGTTLKGVGLAGLSMGVAAGAFLEKNTLGGGGTPRREGNGATPTFLSAVGKGTMKPPRGLVKSREFNEGVIEVGAALGGMEAVVAPEACPSLREGVLSSTLCSR